MNQQSSDPSNGIDAAWLLLGGLVAVVAVVGVTLLLWGRNDEPEPVVRRDPSRSQVSPPAGPLNTDAQTPSGDPPASVLARLDQLLMDGKVDAVRGELDRLHQAYPTSPAVIVLVARAAELSGERSRAIELYDQITPAEPRWYPVATFESAVVRLRAGDFRGAESRLREVLGRDPNHLGAHEQLARLLSLEGRRWESAPHLYALIKARKADIRHLRYAGKLFAPIEERELLEEARKAYPDQWLAELGLARLDFKNGDWARARQRLELVRQHRPDILEGHVAWGQLLAEQGEWQSLIGWNQQLDSAADRHPLVWWLRGRWAEAAGQRDAAIRCYWESMRIYAGDSRPCYRLGKLLLQTGRAEAAKAYLDYANQLDRLAESIELNATQRPDARELLRAARITEQLGRFLESAAWYYFALQRNPKSQEVQDGFIRVQERASSSNRPVARGESPADRFRFGDLPLPDWSQSPPQRVAQAGNDAAVAIKFEDRAADMGIRFRVQNGDDPDQPGFHLWQAFGGGISVLDFDADGWPDLYAVQENTNVLEPQPGIRDRLFRNQSGSKYIDVTDAARLQQFRFGQSAAIGDYNGDGFDDVLIANIGQNRLLRNEGDGTFTDVSAQVGLTNERWSTAAALADLNHDGLDEILIVNYLAGREPITRKCVADQVDTACRPTMFDPDVDELLWNRGDGSFAPGVLQASPGRGLGVVVADIDADGNNDVFVANDMTANHLYWNDLTDQQPAPLVDAGLIAGVAVDADGRSQACMGIAFGDLQGDGLPDLFVTNFFQESNTLYRQMPDRLFVEETAEAGLRDAGIPLLGFGTQFVDLDGDGWLDVVVANGLIDQPPMVQYRMPTQVFHNAGQGVFTELRAADLGAYFSGRYLGRGVSVLDADRDGRPDIAVAHLDAPLALLMNQGEADNHFVSLQLTSAATGRAVGARVMVTAAGRTQRRDVTAGDGYAAANDRRIIVGIGSADVADKVEIHWPDGHVDTFTDVQSGEHWIAVEKWPALIRWPAE